METIPNNLIEHPRCYNCGITMIYKGTVGSLANNDNLHRFESECPHQTVMHFTTSGDKIDNTHDNIDWFNRTSDDGRELLVQTRAIDHESISSSMTYVQGYIDALKSLHPDLNLSYGYIGNLYTTGPIDRRDDRHWSLSCRSGGVRKWYMKEDPRFFGHEPYWHNNMTLALGKTSEIEERLTKAIRDGSLVKWISNMSYRYTWWKVQQCQPIDKATNNKKDNYTTEENWEDIQYRIDAQEDKEGYTI